MIEITKDSLNSAEFVDNHVLKKGKNAFTNKISTEAKTLLYLFGALAILVIANITLIYSFYKILMKI